MTLSIAALCPDTGQFGVGAITHMIGIGKIVTHARPGVGAIATQGEMNPYHGIVGLERLAAGHSAREALEPLLASDDGREHRQTAGVDAQGRSWAWSGTDLPEWRGHRLGDGWTVQGNRLVGPEAVDAVADAYLGHRDAPFAERLLLALEAGHATGADHAGERSATLYVMAHEEYPLWDIRVDQAEDPVAELRRMHDLFREEVVPVIEGLPSRPQPPSETRGQSTVV
jgi:uncharacterized Ntn-hydrolase superfamily protein